MNGESSRYIKIGQGKLALYMKTSVHLLSYLVPFFIELEMIQTKFAEKIRKRTHILGSVFFFSKIVRYVR